jgi:hypothetical protein
MNDMSSPGGKGLPKSIEVVLDKPFDGLFGDTAELRVLQEIVADPYSNYTHRELMDLTGLSDPSVRRGIRVLIDQGIIRNISSARRSPLYRADLDSKKLTALTLLSYASLDERTGSTSMDDAVRHYCDYIPLNIVVLPLAEGSNLVRYKFPSYGQVIPQAGRSQAIVGEA